MEKDIEVEIDTDADTNMLMETQPKASHRREQRKITTFRSIR